MDIHIFNKKIQVLKYSIRTKISFMLHTPGTTIPAHCKQPCVLHFGSVVILLYEGNPPVVTCNVGFLFVFIHDNISGIYPSFVYHSFMASLSLTRDPSYGNVSLFIQSPLEGYFGCSQSLETTNNSTVNIYAVFSGILNFHSLR